MDKCVRFTIPKNGPTKVEAIGFSGSGCHDAVNAMLSKMSAVPAAEPEFTPDYYKEAPVHETEVPDGG